MSLALQGIWVVQYLIKMVSFHPQCRLAEKGH